MNIILASQSPRRRQLIKMAFPKTRFESPDLDETVPEFITTPQSIAEYLAEEKALKTLRELDYPEDTLVIGCDTIVVMDDEIFGKPADSDEARRMLERLSDREHYVMTAVCIIDSKLREESFVEETKVVFNPLSNEDINLYIESGDPFDKAGAYGIQSVPENFIYYIDGDYDNVVGLPLQSLLKYLNIFEKRNSDQDSL